MSGRAFNFDEYWGRRDPAAGWQFLAGSFTGQQRDDLFGYNEADGSLHVGTNTGSNFSFQAWGNADPINGWKFFAGKFTTSGLTDILGYRPSDGTLWLGRNTGSGFAFEKWSTLFPAADWQFAVGFFTGVGRSELVAYHPSNGSVWVAVNTGTGFELVQWGSLVGSHRIYAGDFTGTGRTDVLAYNTATGQLQVGDNTGTTFRWSTWAELPSTSVFELAPGYFSGRAKVDLFVRDPASVDLSILINTGHGFELKPWGSLSDASGWQLVAGSFNGDAWTDLVAYYTSSGALWMGRSAAPPIDGYAWPLSAAPGEPISFMMSGDGPISATVKRHTSTSENIDSVEMMTLKYDAEVQPTNAAPYANGCGWSPSFTFTIPNGWRSGIYSLRSTDAQGNSSEVTFIVKPRPEKRSKIAVLANVNTWLTYNAWGGQSKYTGLARTSFLRPCPVGQPAGDSHLTRGELWILGWLEQEGYAPDVYSDIDFHQNGLDASQYKCLVLSTHPEYWSFEMYDHLKAYLEAGGRVLYLGANGVSEYGTYNSDLTEMTFRAGVEGGSRTAALFRMQTDPVRAERSLLGVCTERCSAVGRPYKVVMADHFLFSGITVTDPATASSRTIQNEDTFGDKGLGGVDWKYNGKASAWEVDTHAGPGATGIPLDCAFEEATGMPVAVIPTVDIIAQGVAEGSFRGADMIYYDHPAGGFVFAAGSLTFGGSLVLDPIIQSIMHNVLTHAGL